MKVLLIDNYDSFTYNLKELVESLNVLVDVVRNDVLHSTEIEKYEAILISPGPGIPDEAGDLKNIIQQFGKRKPILGICLGMQAIAEVYEAKLLQLSSPVHGKASTAEHFGEALFKNIPAQFSVGKYHSWVVEEKSIYKNFILTSTDENGLVMGIRHRDYPMYGLQFHPESILTKEGKTLIANFLEIAKTQCNEKAA